MLSSSSPPEQPLAARWIDAGTRAWSCPSLPQNNPSGVTKLPGQSCKAPSDRGDGWHQPRAPTSCIPRAPLGARKKKIPPCPWSAWPRGGFQGQRGLPWDPTQFLCHLQPPPPSCQVPAGSGLSWCPRRWHSSRTPLSPVAQGLGGVRAPGSDGAGGTQNPKKLPGASPAVGRPSKMPQIWAKGRYGGYKDAVRVVGLCLRMLAEHTRDGGLLGGGDARGWSCTAAQKRRGTGNF